jgi:hypothetical protein
LGEYGRVEACRTGQEPGRATSRSVPAADLEISRYPLTSYCVS